MIFYKKVPCLGADLHQNVPVSRAPVTPAVRDRDHPYGKAHLSDNMAEKVGRGNRHASFVLAVLIFCRDHAFSLLVRES